MEVLPQFAINKNSDLEGNTRFIDHFSTSARHINGLAQKVAAL